MEKSKPILSSLAIASFLIGFAINLSPASAQTDEQTQRELYDNNASFEQLSGAARSLLELKFGKKDASPTQATAGSTTLSPARKACRFTHARSPRPVPTSW